MEEIQLNESEQRYFGDLFACYDSENTGKIPISKAAELFRSANIPLEVLKQITDICGGGRTNYLGRKQFFLALKLIAAFQAGLPLRPELFQSNIDIPLPRLSKTNTLEMWDQQTPDLIQLSDSDRSPNQPPVNRMPISKDNMTKRTESSPPNGITHSPITGLAPKSRSPEASSTASDSPTPTNSVQERNWAAATQWHGLVCEEQRQLLGTEEESSDRHSSEDDGESEVWIITDEQRDYYTAQFRSLQPDPSGLVAGPVARLFFEKSRLPVQELRKIWQLADVTKDGALSLDEFNTAMHLVVLRRNNIELPDCLPPSLVPINASQHVTDAISHEESPPNLSPPAEDSSPHRSSKDVCKWTKFVDSPTSSVSSPGPKPVNFDFHKSAVEQDPKILHPVPLRVTPESQGVGPVADDEPCRSPRKPAEPQPIPYEQLGTEGNSPKKGITSNSTNISTVENSAEIRPIQRPQPKKPAAPGPGAIPPPPQPVGPLNSEENSTVLAGSQSGPTSLPTSSQMGPKKEPPPPPPPRPYRSHTRSSSLDLNKLGKSGGLLGIPPVVPPRTSPSTTSPKKLIGQHSEGDVLSLISDQAGFADFGQFGHDDETSLERPSPRKHGAFEVYRKPSRTCAPDTVLGLRSQDSPSDDVQPCDSSVLRSQHSLRRLQEQNALLIRVCQELSQELAEVQEERASLEIQLEHIKAQLAE